MIDILKFSSLLLCILLPKSTFCAVKQCPQDPDENRSTVELIESRGFNSEVHTVTTKDNYMLIVHRIVNPLCQDQRKPPVLLQHGILSSSADWVINSPGGGINDGPNVNDSGNNLGFLLSKACYDVWMSNSRGNIYSLRHRRINVKSSDFWKFSFDEMAQYDQPAFIDYILNVTGFDHMSYVGHSQGTTQMFALLSNSSEYSAKIKPFIALAPVAMLGNTKSKLLRAATEVPFLDYYLHDHPGPFIISDHDIHLLSKLFCQHELDVICLNLIFLLSGYDEPMVNRTRLQVYYQHTPAGTSNWAILHYLQLVKSRKFTKMDFGKETNLIKYGQKTPPNYPLEKITNQHIALIYGLGDWLADPKDVQLLKNSLTVPLIDDYALPFPKWNHLDFLWGKSSGEYVNKRILGILSKYWPSN